MDTVVTPSPRRAYWLRTLHQWHWISSALCLIGMLLFAFTGLTLNHADSIEAKPRVSTREATLPAEVQAALAAGPEETGREGAPLPDAAVRWLADTWRLEVAGRAAEWSPEEVYLPLPRPGGDAWLRIDRATGAAEHELTERGWISYLNDLHKGRHTGVAWSWFLDVFSVACLVFSITGLLILQMHGARRPATWPLVGAGLVLPWLLLILFVH